MNNANPEEHIQRSKLTGRKRKHKEVSPVSKKIEKTAQDGAGPGSDDKQLTIDNMLKKMIKTEENSREFEEIKEKSRKKRNPNKTKEP